MKDNQSPVHRMAEAILLMTYNELMSIGSLLRDMHDDRPRNLSDPIEWAELLNSWAVDVEGNP